MTKTAAQPEQQAPLSEKDVESVVDKVKERAAEKDQKRTRAREIEGTLVDEAKAGDARAFRKLVEMNQGRLFAVAVGMLRDRDEAMDVVQDAFIKAHRKLDAFEGNSAFSTWLYRICVNLCIDKKRSQARRKKVDFEEVKGFELTEDSIFAQADIAPKLGGANPLQNVKNQELAGQIEKAMATLSDDHKAVILLREIEGMSYEEISQSLEIPKGTVMSRLFHARKNLQAALRPYLGLTEGQTLADIGKGDHVGQTASESGSGAADGEGNGGS